VQVETPCDSGTLRLRAYPDGAGVGMTATLRHTTQTHWDTYAYVTPYNGYTDEGNFPGESAEEVVHDGFLALKTDNLSEPLAVGGYSHKWPQSAEVDLIGDPKNHTLKAERAIPFCTGTSVYLTSGAARAQTLHLRVSVGRRAGTVHLTDSYVPTKGPWQVTVTVRSPAGTHSQTQSVWGKGAMPGVSGYGLATTFKRLAGLRNFASATVTVSRGSKRRDWLTLSRTP
jgi:hypothetical protein